MLWEDGATGDCATQWTPGLHRRAPRCSLVLGGFDPARRTSPIGRLRFTVSLGNAVLRAETAGPIALALLQYAWGDLGRRPRGDTD
jgi:hypothetical protein